VALLFNGYESAYLLPNSAGEDEVLRLCSGGGSGTERETLYGGGSSHIVRSWVTEALKTGVGVVYHRQKMQLQIEKK